MSITLTSITTLVRYLINDTVKTMSPGDIIIYDTSSVFTLTESNAISVSAVYKNDVELESGTYSYDSDTQKLTVSASLTSGDTIEIRYTYYPNYSDTEIQNYIQAAIIHLSVNNFYNYTISDSKIFPDPTPSEQRLIAIVTALLIEPDNKTYRLPDLTINVPRDLPLHDKIRKVIMRHKQNSHGTFDIL